MSRLPNFFLVGAPKAGTTSLFHYLDQHPQIYMSPIKEPNFFAAEIREENFVAELHGMVARDQRRLREYLNGPMHQKRLGGMVSEWDDYVRLFANANQESALGEASVCYLWSPTAPERIAERIPAAKILVMLRNPVDRAFSDYLQNLGNGDVRWSLREHIQRNLRHRSASFSVHYPFLELGLYAEQLGRYLHHFGSNVWIEFYENFKSRPLEVFHSICGFLGVDRAFSPDMTRRYLEAQVPRLAMAGWPKRFGVWQSVVAVTPPSLRPFIGRAMIRKSGTARMDAADRRYLVDYYREDIGKLATLLGRNLDGWLNCD